jgi:OPT family oligopeptide transporter
MIAAGAISGLRVTVWMTVAGLLLAYLVGPWGIDETWTNAAGTVVAATTKPGKAWKELGLWLGAPMMVSSGILAFAIQWKTIVRAFKGILGRADAADAHKAAVEVPSSWFAAGFVFAGLGLTILCRVAFDIPLVLGALAVILAFALALVAARATGETDITPIGAMGKIVQLTYGVLMPQSVSANLMTAAITSSAASSSADLLNDLKSGYLLGANPRRQFIAQMMGIFSGTIASVLGFYALVPDATVLLGTDSKPPAFPAPAAQAWKAVAEVFKLGIHNMHPAHQKAIVVGLAVGALVVGLELLLPRWKKYLPSATGLGLGFILPFQYPLSMLLGAVIAALWSKKNPTSAKELVVPLAAGVIAGVSIVGVMVAAINNFVLG